jgi:hypothetical protein
MICHPSPMTPYNQGPDLTAKERLAPLPQLGALRIRKAVQGAGQGPTRAQARIHLNDGATAHEDADQHIEQFVGGRCAQS